MESVTKQILDAASKVKKLEIRDEVHQHCLEAKNEELHRVTAELLRNDETMHQVKKKYHHLKSVVRTLENEISRTKFSREESYQWHSGDDSSLDVGLTEFERVEQFDKADTPLDAENLRRKVDRLQARVTELLSSNKKWNKTCHKLQRELDEVKKELERTTELLCEERKKTDQVEEEFRQHKEETGHKLQHARARIELLETQVRELEKEKAETLEKLQQASGDVAVYQFQAETFEQDYNQEKSDHARAKANLASVSAQSSILQEELQRKTEKLEKSIREKETIEKQSESLKNKLRQLLEEINVIKDQQHQTNESKTPELVRHEASEEHWQCGKCTYINSLVCQMCTAPKSASSIRSGSVVASPQHQPTTEQQFRPAESRPYHQRPPWNTNTMGELEEDSVNKNFFYVLSF